MKAILLISLIASTTPTPDDLLVARPIAHLSGHHPKSSLAIYSPPKPNTPDFHVIALDNYIGKICVGSPPQNLSVKFDSTKPSTWLSSSSYHYEKSSTVKYMNAAFTSYDNGQLITGYLKQDLFDIAGLESRIDFGLVDEKKNYDGVVGMGLSDLNWFQKYIQSNPCEFPGFAYYPKFQHNGKTYPEELTLCGYYQQQHQQLKKNPVTSKGIQDGTWQISISKLNLGNDCLISSSSENYESRIDTTASKIQFPQKIFAKVMAKLNGQKRGDDWVVDCDGQVQGETYPALQFGFDGGDYTLHWDDFVDEYKPASTLYKRQCSEGEMMCSGQGFLTCNFGGYVYRDCGPGTVCMMVNGQFPTCGYGSYKQASVKEEKKCLVNFGVGSDDDVIALGPIFMNKYSSVHSLVKKKGLYRRQDIQGLFVAFQSQGVDVLNARVARSSLQGNSQTGAAQTSDNAAAASSDNAQPQNSNAQPNSSNQNNNSPPNSSNAQPNSNQNNNAQPNSSQTNNTTPKSNDPLNTQNQFQPNEKNTTTLSNGKPGYSTASCGGKVEVGVVLMVGMSFLSEYI